MWFRDGESLLEKKDNCANNLKKSYTIDFNKKIAFGFSIFTKFAYGDFENTIDFHKCPDLFRNFSENLKKTSAKND